MLQNRCLPSIAKTPAVLQSQGIGDLLFVLGLSAQTSFDLNPSVCSSRWFSGKLGIETALAVCSHHSLVRLSYSCKAVPKMQSLFQVSKNTAFTPLTSTQHSFSFTPNSSHRSGKLLGEPPNCSVICSKQLLVLPPHRLKISHLSTSGFSS